MFSRDHMHSLQNAPSPGTTLVSVRTVEFRFGIVDVCVDHRAVGAHRDYVFAVGFTGGDGIGIARPNVVVRGGAPLFALLAEPSHENGFLVQIEVALADDRREDKIVGLTKLLEPSEHRRGTDWNSHHR